MNLPILDTAEKLRDYICKEWQGNYEPHDVDAFVTSSGIAIIQLSSSYYSRHASLDSSSHGRITVDTKRFVDKSVIPVLREAYRKHEEAERIKLAKHREIIKLIEATRTQRTEHYTIQENEMLRREIEILKKQLT